MVKINNLTVSFGENRVINNFTCHIKSGEKVCISGPSGKGKTTLFRTICGLEKNFEGDLTIRENTKIGVVFQDDVLLPWYSAKENVSIVSTEEAAVKWLTAFGLADALDKKPNQLSGGMKRRVAIARACAFNPDVLILDEAFKGLDHGLKKQVIEKLKAEYQNKTIIFASHDKEEIEMFASRIIEL